MQCKCLIFIEYRKIDNFWKSRDKNLTYRLIENLKNELLKFFAFSFSVNLTLKTNSLTKHSNFETNGICRY